MRPPRIFATLLLAALALPACQPTPVAVGRRVRDLPVAADYIGANAKLIPLPASGPFALPPGQPALVALATAQTNARAMLALRPVPEVGAATFALTGLSPRGPEPGGPLSAADRQAEAELSRKAAEAPLRGLRPHPRYGLQQAALPLLPGARQSFWVISRADRRGLEETSVEARAAFVGDACDVFVDTRAAASLDARAVELGRAFDERIYPTDTKLFGPPIFEGVDADGRVTLLITPEVGDFGSDGTLGYFTVRDLFSPEDAPNVDTLTRSNRRLMLYLSSELVQTGGEADVLGTLAHELEHLINASRKLFGPANAQAGEDTWLDEGLAMAAMHANGWGLGPDALVLTSHVEGFLNNPNQFSLTNWEASGGRGVGSSYGLAYLFVMYLAQRLGDGVYSELVDSPAIGLANVEAACKRHGTTVDALWKDFAAAVLLDGVKAAPEHGFDKLNLRGNGRGGPALTLLPDDAAGVEGSVLPYSLRYILASPGSGLLELGGNAASKSSGWIVTP